jgi:hypothetical protein
MCKVTPKHESISRGHIMKIITLATMIQNFRNKTCQTQYLKSNNIKGGEHNQVYCQWLEV